jgi:hypothetical protein
MATRSSNDKRIRIVGAVPRTVKDAQRVAKVYAPASNEIKALRGSAYDGTSVKRKKT